MRPTAVGNAHLGDRLVCHYRNESEEGALATLSPQSAGYASGVPPHLSTDDRW